MSRVHPPRDPVALQLDGEDIVADRGEPVAIALIAAGHLALARSPKFHRPRGPSCLRAACDGCLARVDDEPNVMTCRTPAADAMRIETQNVVGSSETDLLRATDWFFPEGMNHHELFVGIPGAQRVLQALARRVAGLGRLPGEARAPRSAGRRAVDALVVGAGPAGMAVALELAKRGRKVEVMDDDLCWGGSLRALALAGASPWEPLWKAFGESVAASRLAVRLRTTAAGIYGEDVLVAGESGVEVLTARTLVLAPGAHDGVLAFEGNDIPGVMSARAGGWIASRGVILGKRVVVVVADGGGPFADAYARAAPDAVVLRGAPVRASGSRRIREVTVATPRGERRFACDALLVDAPRAPAYELCAQAGAKLAHEPHGYVVRAPGGKIRDGVFAVGDVVGTPLALEAIMREAEAVSETA
ncbi:MAG TPA: 2Fe-2S iron-sulfur cluster-binding protein [Polyangiaceae bacterium]|nr:2Fe-2S iron-sulfur cluster-binding protein [Polyangiaceae bacterium]